VLWENIESVLERHNYHQDYFREKYNKIYSDESDRARYGDGAGNTVEENSGVLSLIRMRSLPSVL